MQCYRNVFLNTPDGRVILNDLMKASGLFQINGVTDSDELQHRTGSMDMVRRIISILALDEDKIINMTLNLDEGDNDDG